MNYLRQGLLSLLLIGFSGAYAQKTMMQDVSPQYLDTLIKIAKENYPRIRTLNTQIKSAQTNLSKGRLSWFDILSFFYLYSPKNSTTIINPSVLNGYQFGVSINIGSILQKPAQIKVLKNDLEVAQYTKDEYMLNLEANVKDRYYQYLEKLTLVKLRTQSSLDAEATVTSIRSRFERGQETFENYTRILALYTEQTNLKIIAEADLLSAKAFLEELLNKKLEEIK